MVELDVREKPTSIGTPPYPPHIYHASSAYLSDPLILPSNHRNVLIANPVAASLNGAAELLILLDGGRSPGSEDFLEC
jgi:hypothetical protein